MTHTRDGFSCSAGSRTAQDRLPTRTGSCIGSPVAADADPSEAHHPPSWIICAGRYRQAVRGSDTIPGAKGTVFVRADPL